MYKNIACLSLTLLSFWTAGGCRTQRGAGGDDYELMIKKVDETARGLSAQYFAADRLVEVDIKMKDWDTLRKLEPAGGRCSFKFLGSQYEWMAAEEVSVNGHTFKNVGIKKRSHCGSLSDTKPNLGIKFDKHQKSNKDLALGTLGVNTLTLNNSRQDPSLIRQCLAYRLFARAGIDSPRCNYARIRVNGQDLGAYVNVENMDAQAMGRIYGLPLGTLYKIEVDEFKDSHLDRWTAHFEGFADDASNEPVKAIIAAIKNDKTDDLSGLGALVDFDNYIRYWAMEMLLIHSDGMIRHNNNTYVYFPAGGKMQILPSGPDKTLMFEDKPVHKMLYRKDFIADRLLEKPAYREQLKSEIRQLLSKVWDEALLMKEIDQDLALVQPLVSSDLKAKHDESLASLRTRIKERPAEMEDIIKLIDQAEEPTSK